MIHTIKNTNIIIDNVEWADGKFLNVNLIDLSLDSSTGEISYNYETDLQIPTEKKQEAIKIIESAITALLRIN